MRNACKSNEANLNSEREKRRKSDEDVSAIVTMVRSSEITFTNENQLSADDIRRCVK